MEGAPAGHGERRRATRPDLLRPGDNCWCIEPATRAAALVDAADYFAAFAEACAAAQRQILILGWDFDRHEALHRDDRERDLPEQVGAFLAALVRRNSRLSVYLLSWDFNMIYAAEREMLPALRLRLQAPRRFHFHLDDRHPPGASHHQKVVVIDDRVAFVGGIDLGRWRWDTPEHAAGDPRRIDPRGKPYPPFHDLMMLVEGPVARRLGDLARERWRRARGSRIAPPGAVDGSPWPRSVKPDFDKVEVAIARTEPAYAGRQAVREVEQLYLDAIGAARHFVYIENQYFTAQSLTLALCRRLAEPDGPQVVLVLPRKTGGWLEQATMDVLRARVVRDLLDADRHDRLRIYYPHQPGLGSDCISMHAKLVIVDDRLLRIGSANASNRSMGLDTECDLAIEAADPDDPAGAAIRSLRQRLLAEHLGVSGERLAAVENDTDGLIATIEHLLGRQRSLRRLDWRVARDIDELVPDHGLIDPHEPFSPNYFVSEYIPREERRPGRRRVITFVATLAVLLALAAAWRWTPLQDWLSPQRLSEWLYAMPSPTQRALAAIGAVVAASLLMVPLTLLAVFAGIAFAGGEGFAYVFAGALISAAIGFLAGERMSRGVIERLSGSRLDRLSQRLARRGTVAVAILRMVPVAPFAVFNLVAGASHLGFGQFMLGTALGLAPGLAAITLFSSTLWAAVTAPSLDKVLIALAIGGGLGALALLARRWLRSR